MFKAMVKSNDENVLITDEYGAQKTISLINYLNVGYYTWKERLVNTENNIRNIDAWLESLNYSLDKAYALVEKTDETVLASNDIDSASISARATFLIQSNKVSNLDYLITKVRNAYLGQPQEIQNSYGDKLMAYINVGVLLYDNEPFDTQIGEVIQVSVNFTITYLTEALTYADTPVYISLTNNVDTDYMLMPYTKGTWQNIFTGQAFPSQVAPNRTGVINTSVSKVATLSFYNFNKTLMLSFNDLFWSIGAYSIDGTLQTAQSVNIPIWVKVISNGKTYVYKLVITDMQLDLTNSDFNISSITVKQYAKG